jgi:hypothetical protein
MKLIAIAPELVDDFWPQLEPLVARVLDVAFDDVSMQGIYQRLLSSEELALCAVDDNNQIVGLCIIGVTVFETGKRVLQMPYVAGDNMMDWLMEGFHLVNRIARDMDCTHIRGFGRPGWERVMPQLKKIRTLYECEVTA